MICNLAEKLKRAGYKLTAPRQAIIEVLESSKDHLSHSQILERGQRICPQLSRATVYRTMELLVELSLVRPLYLNDPTQRFVSATGGHHHLVCTNCGGVIEFDYCPVEDLAYELSKEYRFEIHNHLLEFQGLCEACQQNEV